MRTASAKANKKDLEFLTNFRGWQIKPVIDRRYMLIRPLMP